MKTSLIFDIDGTLWNASESSAIGWNNALNSLGFSKTVSSKDIERVAGKPYEQCIEILLPKLIDKYPNLLLIFNKFEKEAVEKNGGIFYKNVKSGLRKLSKKYNLYLISNCQKWYLEFFLKYSGLTKLFKDCDCHGLSKLPKNKMIKKMINSNNIESSFYIGDTLGDQNATQLANIPFVYVTYGFGDLINTQLSFSTFDLLVDYFMKLK